MSVTLEEAIAVLEAQPPDVIAVRAPSNADGSVRAEMIWSWRDRNALVLPMKTSAVHWLMKDLATHIKVNCDED